MSIMPGNSKGGVDARQQMLLAQGIETFKTSSAVKTNIPVEPNTPVLSSTAEPHSVPPPSCPNVTTTHLLNENK